MKRSSTLYALLTGLCVASAASATGSGPHDQLHLKLQKQAGHVEFFAVGWPSALKIHGKGAGPEGELEVVARGVSGSIGFDLETLETGIGLRDRHLKEQYLQTARFPRATLTLSRVGLDPLPEASAFKNVGVPFAGVLSLHGADRPVAGEARVTRDGPRVTVAATFTIDIREFGIDVPSYLGITVAEKVQVKVSFSSQVESGRDVAGR